jgi:hypothetical protein
MQNVSMLTLATLGMFAYGAYSIVWPVVDIVRGAQLELWAEFGLMAFGLLLGLSAALVRTGLPGSLAFALAALLGLQALAVHNAAHLESGLAPQIGRAVLGVSLVALAYAGSERPR